MYFYLKQFNWEEEHKNNLISIVAVLVIDGAQVKSRIIHPMYLDIWPPFYDTQYILFHILRVLYEKWFTMNNCTHFSTFDSSLIMGSITIYIFYGIWENFSNVFPIKYFQTIRYCCMFHDHQFLVELYTMWGNCNNYLTS